ncbi:MAG: 2-oxoacid:acceptor oxidoreductase family protein, partial [Prevotella sp.]|nr:2-oxoacid:acceptor oxidoreductase family protein [Prevotella sp.]
EQRGGTANVTVIVSDDRISSPILSKYDIAIVLNQPSLDKFLPKIKPGGILIYDSYGIINPPQRDDINVYCINAMDKAAEMKNSKVFNMIILGGLLQVCPVVSDKGVEKALFKTLPERHHGLIPLNMEAIKAGREIITKL